MERVPRETAREWAEAPFALLGEAPPPGGDRTRWATRAGGPDGPIFVKRRSRPWYRAFADRLALRPSAARKAFTIGLELEAAGVRSASPLAAIERRLPGESFLILEFLDAPDLHRYLVETLGGSPGEEARTRLKRELWKTLGRAVARLHGARVRQRDLKAPNILVAHRAPEPPEIVLVDLEGMERLPRLPSPSERARDLGRLAASLRAAPIEAAGVAAGDWSEVVRAYLDASAALFDRDADATWWQDRTLAWAHRKEARNRRLGRPLW